MDIGIIEIVVTIGVLAAIAGVVAVVSKSGGS